MAVPALFMVGYTQVSLIFLKDKLPWNARKKCQHHQLYYSLHEEMISSTHTNTLAWLSNGFNPSLGEEICSQRVKVEIAAFFKHSEFFSVSHQVLPFAGMSKTNGKADSSTVIGT